MTIATQVAPLSPNPKDEYLRRLAEVRLETSQLKDRIASLKDEEDHLSAILAQRKNQRAPIRQLTDDILREIFVLCLPESERTFDALEAPLLLCHVCQRWRSLAADCSPLWTSLRLEINQSDPKVALREELLTAWFERCKGAEIDFQLIFRKQTGVSKVPQGWAPFGKSPFAFFSQALAHIPSYNFRNLVLFHLPVETVRSFPSGALPCLERLVLVFHPQGFYSLGEGPIGAFEGCPLLRRVALYGEALKDLKKSIALPWHQLTHFLNNAEHEQVSYWECVSQMANLEYAYLTLGDETAGNSNLSTVLDPEPPLQGRVVLDKLTALSLSFWEVHSAAVTHPDFWFYFDFPNLRSLRIVASGCNFDADWAWGGNAPGFITKLQSMQHLTTLSLCTSTIQPDTCSSLFECFPQVTKLDLESCNDRYADVLQVLTLDGDLEYLPKLRTLVFEVGNEAAFSSMREDGLADDDILNLDNLTEMVESRRKCEPEKRLERIIFYAANPWQLNQFKAFLKCLQPYVEEGLVVEKRVVEKARADKIDDGWFERDEDIADWPEAGEIFNTHWER